MAWDAAELAAALGAEGLADGYDLNTWEEDAYGEYGDSAAAAATAGDGAAEWQPEGAAVEGGYADGAGEYTGEYAEPAAYVEPEGDVAWDGYAAGEESTAYGDDASREYADPGTYADAEAEAAFEDEGAAGGEGVGGCVDWEAHVDAEGNMYFYSHVSDATVWAAPEAALEEGWSGVTEEATGHTYYVHDVSGETRWEAPLRPEVPVIQD